MSARILIVDDDKDVLDILQALLRAYNFDVQTAFDVESFRSGLFSFRPQLIILDVMLGATNGPQHFKKFLAEGFDSTVPVIYLTGLIEENHLNEPIRPERNCVLRSKPCNMTDLMADIQTLLAQAA